jgi:hypothetical protein
VFAGAVDQNVARPEHPHRVLSRDDACHAAHRPRPRRLDQLAERALDGVERTEAQHPGAEHGHQVRWNGLSKGETLVQLLGVEESFYALTVDVVGAVARHRVRDQVVAELDHPGPGVLAALLVEENGEPLHRLEQRRQHETHRTGAHDVHPDLRRQSPGLRDAVR